MRRPNRTRLAPAIVILPVVLAAVGCTGGGGGYGGLQVGGAFVVLSQNCYVDPFINLNNTDVNELTTKLPAYVLASGTKLQSQWSVSWLKDDTYNCYNEPAVYSSYFTYPQAKSADFLWYTGHGDLGRVALHNYVLGNGYNNQEGDATAFGGDDPNIPWSTSSNGSGLKWMFLNSSVSVQYNFPLDQRSDWLRAFNTNANGIHGIYGFEGEPNSFDDVTLVDTFLGDAVQVGSNSNASTVRGSWIDASMLDNGGQYGIYELSSAANDQLSGYSTVAGFTPVYTTNSKWDTSANPLYFYDTTPCTPCVVNPSLSSPLSNVSPGPYTPMLLTPESWTDSYLASQADNYEPGAYKYYQDPNTYRIQSTSYSASHYESSGAVIAGAQHSTVPYSFALSDAENFAITGLQQHGGLPSDAVLYRVLISYQHTSSAAVITGYVFFWRHQADIRGGDKIIVGVDNLSYKQCTSKSWDGCEWVCDIWQTVYNQHINFMYRLWRTIGQPAPTPPTLRPFSTVATGTAELSPSAAYAVASIATQDMNLGTVSGYTTSYWTPPYWSTDQTAYPAYNVYFSGGAVVIVDAGNGAVRSVDEN